MAARVLIIDDDETLCDEVSESLVDEGYDVSVSYDGLEGHELASNDEFDVLLLDLRLPGLDGLEILKRLKENGTRLHVIVVTGEMDPSQIFAVRNRKAVGTHGSLETLRLADAVLSKPIDMPALLSLIKDATAKKKNLGSKSVQN